MKAFARRRSVLALALALFAMALLGACSSSSSDQGASSSTTTSQPAAIDAAWDAGGEGAARVLAAKLGGDDGDCRDLVAYGRAGFLATFQRLGWPFPRWAGRCATASGEDLQVEIWENRDTVAERLRTKATRLCGDHSGGLPGYAVVEGPTFVLQPDTQRAAESIASRVGGRARWQDCASVASVPAQP